jgi:hypothetical protein
MSGGGAVPGEATPASTGGASDGSSCRSARTLNRVPERATRREAPGSTKRRIGDRARDAGPSAVTTLRRESRLSARGRRRGLPDGNRKSVIDQLKPRCRPSTRVGHCVRRLSGPRLVRMFCTRSRRPAAPGAKRPGLRAAPPAPSSAGPMFPGDGSLISPAGTPSAWSSVSPHDLDGGPESSGRAESCRSRSAQQ